MRRTAEEAMRIAVDALGGDKSVGYLLRPEMDPILSGQWVAHCLAPHRREKFSLAQQLLILARSQAAGEHRPFEILAEICGYRVTAVIDPAEEIADMARRAERAAREAGELTDEIRARMRAAHLGID